MENIPIPAKRALATLDKPPADVDADSPAKRISKKVRTAIGYMVNGECKQIVDAAAEVGLARESLSRALSQPHIAEHMRQRVVRHLAIQAARAGAVKGELLDCSNEMVRDRASTFVLGLAGIQPESTPSISVNLNIRAGYVIDISPAPGEIIDAPPMRTIPHG